MSNGSPQAPGLDVLGHAAADGAAAPVPVTVLTGFLGAGKTAGQAWNGEPPRTRIVAIGAHGATDAAGMKTIFDACIAGSGHAPAPR